VRLNALRIPLKRKLRRRLLDSTGWLGLAIAKVLLRLRWLRWRWRRWRTPELEEGEPARDLLWTPAWQRRFKAVAGQAPDEQAWCVQIHPGFRTEPPRIKALDRQTAAAIGLSCRRKLPGTYVAQVPRGRIVSDRGDVISPDGKWLADLSVGNPRWVSRTYPFVTEPIPASLVELGGSAIVLAHHYADGNYFHWLFNCLPRVQLYRQANVDLDQVDRVIVSANSAGYRDETLEHIGVPLDRLVECHETFHARADLVLATTNVYYTYVRPWAHEFLRANFLPSEPPSDAPERIFIRRDRARWRLLVNELECFELLAQHGFVEATLTGMTVAEQAALFSGARSIVSPHEAGLANLVFCEPGTAVFELFPPTWLRSHYAELAAVRGLDYYCLIGETEPRTGNHAYRVPPDALARLIDVAGI
jgi:hypothetical protein